MGVPHYRPLKALLTCSTKSAAKAGLVSISSSHGFDASAFL